MRPKTFFVWDQIAELVIEGLPQLEESIIWLAKKKNCSRMRVVWKEANSVEAELKRMRKLGGRLYPIEYIRERLFVEETEKKQSYVEIDLPSGNDRPDTKDGHLPLEPFGKRWREAKTDKETLGSIHEAGKNMPAPASSGVYCSEKTPD